MKKLIFLVIIFFAFLLILTSTLFGVSKKGKVTLVIIEKLKLSDIDVERTPNFYKLTNDYGLGLVAFRKAFVYKNPPSAFYATLSAGSTASGMELPSWHCLPGKENQSSANVLKGRASHIILMNHKNKTLAYFGALGQSLHKEGLKTAAIGNASSSKPDTEYLNAIMDSQGQIDYVAVEDKDVMEGGLTSLDKVMDLYTKYYEQSSLIAIDYGDLKRFYDYKMQYSKRKILIKKSDELIGKLTKKLKEEDMLIVLMPFSRNKTYGIPAGNLITIGEPLSPVIIKADSYRGLLKSASTRRQGVVSVSDFMPTILDHLGVKTNIKYTASRIYSERYSGNKFLAINNIKDRASRHDAFMIPILFYMGIWGLGVLIIALVAVLSGLGRTKPGLLRFLLLTVFLFPLALNLLALVDFKILWLNILFILTVQMLAIPLLALFKNKLWPLIGTLAITPLMLIVDVFTGQNIANNSFLGTSVLSGGRYYGLGNQYLGLIFVFSFLFFIIFIGIRPGIERKISFKVFTAAAFGLLLLVFGLGSLGANFGALITLAVSLPFAFVRLTSTEKLKWQHMAFYAFFALVVVGGGIFYDSLQNPNAQSHLARSFNLVKEGGWSFAAIIIRTKIMRSLEEIFLILFRWGGLPVFLVIGALFYASRRHLKTVLTSFPSYKRALPAIVLTAITALLYNDTGFEPFIIIILYSLAAFLYLAFTIERAVDNY